MLEELSNPPAIHDYAVAGRPAEARRTLLQLTAGVTRSTFDLGELLVEVKEYDYYRSYGYASFSEYVTKELDLKQRKAEYLTRIFQVCHAIGLVRPDFEKVGISKLRDITSLNPEGSYFNPESKTNEPLADHIVDLITEANDLTKEQVTEKVLELKGMTGGDRPVVRSFSMSKNAWEVVKQAFERLRMHLGSAGRDAEGKAVEFSDGRVLELMAADYLAGDTQDTEIPTEDNNEQLGTSQATPESI